jgi:hypothetical protein
MDLLAEDLCIPMTVKDLFRPREVEQFKVTGDRYVYDENYHKTPLTRWFADKYYGPVMNFAVNDDTAPMFPNVYPFPTPYLEPEYQGDAVHEGLHTSGADEYYQQGYADDYYQHDYADEYYQKAHAGGYYQQAYTDQSYQQAYQPLPCCYEGSPARFILEQSMYGRPAVAPNDNNMSAYGQQSTSFPYENGTYNESAMCEQEQSDECYFHEGDTVCSRGLLNHPIW